MFSFIAGQAAPDQSLLSLVFGAGIFVQFILLLLIAMSVLTWAIIFFKRKIFNEAEARSSEFVDLFDRAPDLSEGLELVRGGHREAAPARVLMAGLREARREEKAGSGTLDERSRRIDRVLRDAVGDEIARLERRLAFLATTGSTAPFIGLLGTVWGIMRSFRDIGVMKSADLSVVAPGIAEALIATAVGLFAAIPAVMGYNHFIGRIKDFRRRLNGFADYALNRIEREWPSGD